MLPPGCEARGSQLGEWLGIANAIGGFLGAVAGVVATVIAFSALEDQRRARREEQQRSLYRAVVLELAMTLTPRLVSDARAFLTAGERDVANIQGVMDLGVGTIARRMADEYNSRYFELAATLRNATIAWGDPLLQGRLQVALEALQDAVLSEIEELQNAKIRTRPLADVCAQKAAELMQVLVAYDPESVLPPEVRSLRWIPFRRHV